MGVTKVWPPCQWLIDLVGRGTDASIAHIFLGFDRRFSAKGTRRISPKPATSYQCTTRELCRTLPKLNLTPRTIEVHRFRLRLAVGTSFKDGTSTWNHLLEFHCVLRGIGKQDLAGHIFLLTQIGCRNFFLLPWILCCLHSKEGLSK
jgi:hypothetical protein